MAASAFVRRHGTMRMRRAGSNARAKPTDRDEHHDRYEGGADSGPPDGLYDCDTRKVMCRRAPPVCDTFEVPAIEGTCYGECVKIDLCACSNADQCPDANQYTCWMSTHCGPYVQ